VSGLVLLRFSKSILTSKLSGSPIHVSIPKQPQKEKSNSLLEYSWFNALTDTAPQLETASYRFRPSTGAVSLIDNSVAQPNGIAISPRLANCSATEGRTVYISDTGAISGPIEGSLGPQGTTFNTTGKRVVYAYDLTSDGNHIVNKRPVYSSQDWVPDGLKVAKNGYIGAY
jgi:hypothetical protein